MNLQFRSIIKMFSGVPMFRDLSRCRQSDFGEAAKEVFGSFLLALVPIWLGAIILAMIPSISAVQYIDDFFISGESLLVSTALLGPNFYIATKKYGSFKDFSVHFPQAWFLTVLSVVICMITAAIFGSQRVYMQFASRPNSALFDSTIMFWLALGILAVTALALYLVTVFKNYAEGGAAAKMHSDEDDFVTAFRAATKKKGRRK